MLYPTTATGAAIEHVLFEGQHNLSAAAAVAPPIIVVVAAAASHASSLASLARRGDGQPMRAVEAHLCEGRGQGVVRRETLLCEVSTSGDEYRLYI